jgi:plant cysteine oxidase
MACLPGEMSPIIQRVCEECARALRDGLDAEASSSIARLMDGLSPADIGLRGSGDLGSGSGVIRTHSIYEGNGFDVVIFLFPARARIPFHDHPGMTVFSKVLYGSLSIKSVDWQEPLSQAEQRALQSEQKRVDAINDRRASPADAQRAFVPRAVSPRANTILTSEAPTFVLRPEFANIHCFEALSECAVLDVLLPPYNDDDRDCHYYELLPPGADVTSGAANLQLGVIAPPDSLVIRRGDYLGPQVRLLADEVVAGPRRG